MTAVTFYYRKNVLELFYEKTYKESRENVTEALCKDIS